MTKRIGNIVVIEVTPSAKCDFCGKMEELRPYGPQGENVCFTCGQKDPVALKRAMNKMFGHNGPHQ